MSTHDYPGSDSSEHRPRGSAFAHAFIAAIDAMDDPHRKRREAVQGWLSQNDFVQVPDYDTFAGKGDWHHKSGQSVVSAGLVQDCVEGHMSWTDLREQLAGIVGTLP